MASSPRLLASPGVHIQVHEGRDLSEALLRLQAFLTRGIEVPLSRHPAWLTVLERGLHYTPYCIEAVSGERTHGFLPLAFVQSWLFGRFLVSLPYLNYGGVVADDEAITRRLIDEAVRLADRLKAAHLELRHERGVEHPAFNSKLTSKVNLRLALSESAGELWDRLDGKVRNQVRRGQKNGLAVAWGGPELLADYYTVFSHNMRDLGTPVYGRSLFRSILEQFPDRAELCVVRTAEQPVAAALLLHGWGVTEVPSASSVRAFNKTNANMLMYWNLLERAVQRKQKVFDFGRSSREGPHYDFKRQWGAVPEPAEWQYYVRNGQADAMRRENPRYQRFIQVWQRLPLWLTRLLGPFIVRGIP